MLYRSTLLYACSDATAYCHRYANMVFFLRNTTQNYLVTYLALCVVVMRKLGSIRQL